MAQRRAGGAIASRVGGHEDLLPVLKAQPNDTVCARMFSSHAELKHRPSPNRTGAADRHQRQYSNHPSPTRLKGYHARSKKFP